MPPPNLTVADAGNADTLLAFLTTSCASCQPLWGMLADAIASGRLAAGVAVVTPSRSMEDEPLAKELLPSGAELHMGSETWFDYGVTRASTFVLVRSPKDSPPAWQEPGLVLGTGSAQTPDELIELVEAWQARTAREPA